MLEVGGPFCILIWFSGHFKDFSGEIIAYIASYPWYEHLSEQLMKDMYKSWKRCCFPAYPYWVGGGRQWWQLFTRFDVILDTAETGAPHPLWRPCQFHGSEQANISGTIRNPENIGAIDPLPWPWSMVTGGVTAISLFFANKAIFMRLLTQCHRVPVPELSKINGCHGINCATDRR